MRPVIWPYGPSNGARALADALHTRRVRTEGTYRGLRGDCIINWGNSGSARFVGAPGTSLLNSPRSVAVAADKLRSFEAFSRERVPCPEWTTNIAEARRWIEREGKAVCRTLLRASEGRGIVVASTVGELVRAPLYVKFFPKETEFRVHVFRGEVIDVAQKRLRNGERDRPNRSPYIRNIANGWVFTHQNVRLPEQAREAAICAVRSVGLDFGAVDLAVNNRGVVKVFEVNTAPGIEGTTVEHYARAIQRFCRT